MGSWDSAMRGGQGRCPPFLVAGLAMACVVLLYNYWSLSMQNFEILKQVGVLQDELKIISTKHIECERQHEALHNRLQDTEDEMGKLQVVANRRDDEVKEANSLLQRKEGDVTFLKNDLENTRQEEKNCREEMKIAESSLATKDELIAKLQSTSEKIMKEKHAALAEAKEKEKRLMTTIDQLKEEKQKLEAVEPQGDGFVPMVGQALSPVPPGSGATGGGGVKPPGHVYVQSKGLKGMVWHGDQQILVYDPPDAHRPSPRFSVANLAAGKLGASVGNSKVVTGDPLRSKAQLDADQDREMQHKLVLEKPGKKDEGAAEVKKQVEKDNVLEVPKQQKAPENNDNMEDDIDPSRLVEDADQNDDGTLEIDPPAAQPVPKPGSMNNQNSANNAAEKLGAEQGANSPGVAESGGIVEPGAGVVPAPGNANDGAALDKADRDSIDRMAKGLDNIQQEANGDA